MKLIGKALALGFAVATASVVACSTGPHNTTPGSSQNTNPGQVADGTGEVGFQYTLPGGEHITSVTYTLSSTATGYSKTATVNVGTSSVISFVVGGVTAGGGYSITLTATSDDGLVSCSGSAGTGTSDAGQNNGPAFTVTNRTTTVVNVQMVCVDVPNQNQGNVLVNGIPSCCATWDTMVANPQGQLSTSAPGNSATVTGNASGPCDGDAGAGVNLNCVWSVINGGHGTIGATTTDNHGNFVANFTCPTSGEIDTLQLFCSDGPLPDGGFCPASLTTGTISITCGAPAPCTLAGESGVAATPPTSPTGTCPNGTNGVGAMVNDGTADSLGNYCCVPACNGGTVATTFPSGTGGCTAPLVNNGSGCCVSLLPCTSATQTNCVKCAGSTGGVCTATEAKFVQHDITRNFAGIAPNANDPAGSCYACLLAKTCLDDTSGDGPNECGDTAAPATCLDEITCILGTGTGAANSSCASSNGLQNCYCGPADVGSACNAASAGTSSNGACRTNIAADEGFPVTDNADILANLINQGNTGGMAGQLLQCGLLAGCTACFN